jgi:subtilisin family serine protease
MQISHPTCISSAVAVGSTTKGDVVSSFSNMVNTVALLAPGGFGGGSCIYGGNNADILSSYPATSSATTNLYACEAGTSMATPHVAGAIAAVRTACPSATASAILSAFQSSGLSITDTRSGAPGNITKSRIRLDAALTALNCGPGSLAVTPSTNIASTGAAGGPFSPRSFN